MTHKNVRTFQKLEMLGGDVIAAKRWVLQIQEQDIPDDFMAIIARTGVPKARLKAIVANPDGRRKASNKASAIRDEIRAARVALAVANATHDARTIISPADNVWGGFDPDALCTIVQRALPATVQPSEFIPTFYDGQAAIAAANEHASALLDIWKGYANRAIAALDSQAVKGIFPNEHARFELSSAVLSNVVMLCEEIIDGVKGTAFLGDANHFAYLEDGVGDIHAMAIYDTLESETGRGDKKESVVQIQNIVTHPCNILNLLGRAHNTRRGAGAALLQSIENRSREDGCTVAYLDAGTKDVEVYYARKHGYSIQRGRRQGMVRRRAGSVTMDREATDPLSDVVVTAEMAGQQAMTRMAKVL